MRFHNLAETLLTSPARVAVLKTLLKAPGREWTGREMARASGVSAPQAMEALYRLYDEALVRQRRTGRVSLWALEERHFLAERLRPLVDVDARSMQALRAALEAGLKGSGAIEAVLFGSVARGDEDPNSDVDIVVVFPDKRRAAAWTDRLRDLEAEILARFGNPVQALVYTTQQIRGGVRARILDVARREGRALEVAR
jgi:predicted nucleotidyltransferase